MKRRIIALLLCLVTVLVFAGSSGTLVYITKSGTKYHRDGCRYLSSSKISISIEDAIKKGYEPCKVCKPNK